MIRSDYLTPCAAAKMVGISRASFLQVARANGIKPHKMPGIENRSYYRRRDVESLLARFDAGETVATEARQ